MPPKSKMLFGGIYFMGHGKNKGYLFGTLIFLFS